MSRNNGHNNIQAALSRLPDDARQALEKKSQRQQTDLTGRWFEQLVSRGVPAADAKAAIDHIRKG